MVQSRTWNFFAALIPLLLALCACGGGGGGGDVGVPAPGEIINEPVTGMRFAWVPAGTFAMGDIQNVGFSDEKPLHAVTFQQGFWMGVTEVTQAQWKNVLETPTTPSTFTGDSRPVEGVNWDDAKSFAAVFSALTGATCRLPTEAEWEYAARGGGLNTLYAGTSSDVALAEYAWYSENASAATHNVGQKLPNALNLRDMSGNVWEWVEDDYHGSYDGAPANGSAWIDSPRSPDRVLRGGSWYYAPPYQRVAFRNSLSRDYADIDIGFRLVCDAP